MTKRFITAAWVCTAALWSGGCSDGAGDVDGVPPPSTGWAPIIAADWSLDPGTERYLCVRTTLERDIDAHAFQAVAPNGTHHTVLTVGPPTGPDGVTECDSFDNHDVLVYGSGLGAEPFELPDGVAVRIEAGQQLLLNLHLYNVTAEPMSARSEIRAMLADPETIHDFAEGLLVGPMDLSIPPGEHTVGGGCTFEDEAYLFGVAPHMHQLGRHMKVVANSHAAGPVTIHDEAYAFEDQQPERVDPVVRMLPGDRIEVECTYQNTGASTVSWGESSDAEMCFAGIYRYPKRDGGFFVCTQ